jgi:hypothetical protein
MCLIALTLVDFADEALDDSVVKASMSLSMLVQLFEFFIYVCEDSPIFAHVQLTKL